MVSIEPMEANQSQWPGTESSGSADGWHVASIKTEGWHGPVPIPTHLGDKDTSVEQPLNLYPRLIKHGTGKSTIYR